MPEAGQTNVDPPAGGSGIRFNPQHFKTTPGIIKIVEVCIGLLCLILASPAYFSGTGFFLFAVVISFLSTIVWIFVYLLSIREALPQIPVQWVLTELINTCILTILYAIGTLVQLIVWLSHGARWYGFGANIAGGVFGIFNTLVYAAGAYLLFVEYRQP
ncbi:CKLF-like MARVEL transmembrane domain-containing protein 7 isoform X1 [Amphibalanus amphitrite]|uniref:CKLF-like MARVEL transmembrane domain-containing protein 7 isoform X1 n=1 Tax=Amphibalanus amphitrite TaxID=1232801 RepID=UPI001C91D74F|nr:CKLF-like MARVEL transmembrane domain-containing protein 7 isoform X1 [Amphibalanus amphitrite]